jgi:glycosyltransferase involved in cell wall biosynthesis
MEIKIDGKKYTVLPTEFQEKPNAEYTTLKMLDRLGEFDRIASLVTELANVMNSKSAIFGAPTHGGYIPFNVSVGTTFLFDCDPIHKKHILENENAQFTFISNLEIINDAFAKRSILLVEECDDSKYNSFVSKHLPIIICNRMRIFGIISNKPSFNEYETYSLSNTKWFVLVPFHLNSIFQASFPCSGMVLHYDNLINLCVMVKNGGDEFVSMLESNLPFIDRWTILDTGSTDDTVANIQRIMKEKPGKLYQEPFVNFGVSRNRCLELAGTQCAYNVMLDDTYHLKANLREFLQCVRGDIYADSFSMYITQFDIAYASNRVFKSKKGLKYKYSIHEVIQEEDNVNVIIPKEKAYIYDMPSDKLVVRTANRKQQDLNMLMQEIEQNPDDPRPYYYMAQTYIGMDQHENAYEWFAKRINHPKDGFQQEKHEACLEAGRIAQFMLKKEPSEYLKWYEKAIEVDNERPDAIYYLASYYLTIGNDIRKAFSYLKTGYKLGYPEHRQYCLKPSVTYTHIPKLLTTCCYEMEEYLLGLEVSNFYLQHNKPDQEPQIHEMIVSWNKIFGLLVHSLMFPLGEPHIQKSLHHQTPLLNYEHGIIRESQVPLNHPNIPVCCIIAPCGLYNWTGSDILTKGMGGSESFTVEMATRIHKNGKYNVVVFCNCEKEEIFNDVRYIPLPYLFGVLQTHFINTCIISRYSEYLPLVMKYQVENIYLMAHDVAFSGNVIPLDNKLKGIFCLSPWHASHIGSLYPSLKNAIKLVGHGVHLDLLDSSNTNKIPYKFIYSSLANRGLCELLKMWQRIVAWKPNATLHIYSDIDSTFMATSFPQLMNEIRGLLNAAQNVFYYGYVSKEMLYESWKTADVWFYPTAFSETFCVTALEAAASKTLAIATDLAGLKHTVGDRGILFDPGLTQNEVMDLLVHVLENKELKDSLIAKNYEWAKTNTWSSQATQLEKHLLVHQFEFRNKSSWTKDPMKRDTIIRILRENSNKCQHILEIGDQCGISLIGMSYEIPNAKYMVLDKWNESIKKSFYSNRVNAGIIEKTTALEDEVISGLMKLYKMEYMFDLIYVNTVSSGMMLYSELVVAWEVLKINGVMIVDHLLEQSISEFAVNKKMIHENGITTIYK